MEGIQRHCLMKAKKVKGNMKEFFRESWWEGSLGVQWDKGLGDKDSGKSLFQTFWIYSAKKKEPLNQ